MYLDRINFYEKGSKEPFEKGLLHRISVECPKCGKEVCEVLMDKKGQLGFGFRNALLYEDGEEMCYAFPRWLNEFIDEMVKRGLMKNIADSLA